MLVTLRGLKVKMYFIILRKGVRVQMNQCFIPAAILMHLKMKI